MTASPDSRGSGHFVILVGPDGVGKTTVARALIEMHPGPSAYFHFLPPLHGPLSPAPGQSPTMPPKARTAGWSVLGWLRLAKNAARCWVGYLMTVRPALRRGALVIGDRWMYGYLVQPYALKFYGPAVLARAVVDMLPRPDLVVNLASPPELILQRKQELTLLEIERELRAWSSLALPNLRTADAASPPPIIAAEILALLASSRRGR